LRPSCIAQENIMKSRERRVEVPGSHKDPLQDARPAGPVDNAKLVDVTVRVRAKPGSDLDRDLATLMAKPAAERKFLTPDELEAKHGADDADFDKIEEFAEDARLSVVRRDPAERSIVLRGTLGALQSAFGAQLEMFHHHTGTFRGRSGSISVPIALKDIVVSVHGLDDRPLRRTRRQLEPKADAPNTGASLATRYKFPTSTDGTGQCIAFIELGGGYRSAEIARYLLSIGVTHKPRLSAVSVNGAHNSPSSSDSDDGEVVLDVEVAGAAAPGARLAVYFANNTDRDFVDAVLRAVHDKTRKPSAISISWGGPESTWTDQSRGAMDDAFKAAALLGITVCAAAGDHGTNDEARGPSGIRVDYPASSPYVLSCGGTDIRGQKEVTWNDGDGWATGGGISTKYPLPAWQSSANKVLSLQTHKPGRGVPDVAGAATNYDVLVDGDDMVSGGTSAVAPLWAALIARLNQALGRRVGFVNPALYAHAAVGFTDITSGDNAALGAQGYPASAGWDPCTGLGVPNGEALKTKL
jgi:kumamolisin